MEVTHLDGPKLANKGREENNAGEGPTEIVNKENGKKKAEKGNQAEAAQKSIVTEKEKKGRGPSEVYVNGIRG